MPTASTVAARLVQNDAPMEAPWNGTTGIQVHPGIWGSPTSFDYTFPAASVTCLLVHPDTSGIGSGATPPLQLSCGSNPAVKRLDLTMELEAVTELCILLFDCNGRRQATIVHGSYSPGTHSFVWHRP